jgi:glycine/D-amino acid oxidase-like deaminating enzyme
VPVKGWLVAYDMPPGSLSGILRHEHTYVLQRSSGLTIVGSTEERVGFDRSPDPDALADLERRGAELWPELRGRRRADAWCGFRPATPSGVPEHGRIAGTNVWLAYGHYRNGILLAPVVARRLAEDIATSLRTG